MSDFPIDWVRSRFPSLGRQVAGRPAVFFDGPAGSQVPQSVIDAVSAYFASSNANVGGAFATAQETDAVLAATGDALAELVGTGDPGEIVFGPNMTTMTFALARALASTWRAGDEVIVTRLDHDANVTPWVRAAESVGGVVHHVGVDPVDCTLRLEELDRALSERTRLVAVAAASNLVGTINSVAEITRRAHAAGAEVFVDAVHYAPHRAMDVAAWSCDYLACSAYKFFGPHIGVLWGRAERLDELPTERLRPVKDETPSRWMHGTQNHECLAGTLAAVDYLAALGRELGCKDASRRAQLLHAFAAIIEYETELSARLLSGLAEIDSVRVWGNADPTRTDQRTPTVSITDTRMPPAALSAHLGERGIFSWNGNSYALPLTETLGLEPDGVLRVGLLHYSTAEEVDRLLDELRAL